MNTYLEFLKKVGVLKGPMQLSESGKRTILEALASLRKQLGGGDDSLVAFFSYLTIANPASNFQAYAKVQSLGYYIPNFKEWNKKSEEEQESAITATRKAKKKTKAGSRLIAIAAGE